MSDTSRLWTVYSIIGIGIVGVIAILRWSFSRQGGEDTLTETIINNQILISDTIAPSCQSVKKMIACLITQSSDNNLRESFIAYYRETLSTRNTLPLSQLDTACQTSLSYMTEQISSLSGNYQTCISL